MEMLTYSLWFTLVWWVLSTLAGLIWEPSFGARFNDVVLIPAIAILLEYLIVR